MSAAVSVRALVKQFGPLRAVDGLDLEVERGECVGLLGPNGAGKTTTIEILEGIQAPTAGEVRVLGRQYGSDGGEIRRRIGIQLQETQLYGKFSVEETVRTFRSFFTRKREVEEILDLVGLGEKREAWIETLSGGQKQRLALACALVGDPELIFLDEPSTGLDPAARRGVWDIVRKLKELRRTVLLTTHYMEEAEVLCDRIVIVNKGKVIAGGTPNQLIDELGAGEVIEIATEPAVEASALLGLPGVVSVQANGEIRQISVKEIHASVPPLLDLLARLGVKLAKLSTRRATLDDVFLKHAGLTMEAAERATPAADAT